ncbi:MAG: hypothetical protein PHQ34_02755 [Methanothrix sp.]|nr:hypothetical protein [Methanothrix sp.]
MNIGLLTRLSLFAAVVALMINIASSAQFVVYVYDMDTNQPASDARVSVGASSLNWDGFTNESGICVFDIPSNLGTMVAVAGKDQVGYAVWKGEFTPYIRLGLGVW